MESGEGARVERVILYSSSRAQPETETGDAPRAGPLACCARARARALPRCPWPTPRRPRELHLSVPPVPPRCRWYQHHCAFKSWRTSNSLSLVNKLEAVEEPIHTCGCPWGGEAQVF